MDGQVTTREDIDAMFAKVTAVFDHIRNVFINESELSKRVEAMQAQINELSTQVQNVTSQNAALHEAVNILTQERDTARRGSDDWQAQADAKETARAQAQADADHWYTQHQSLSQEHEKVKADRSALESDHLKLLEEHGALKARMSDVTSKLEAIYASVRPTFPQIESIHGDADQQPRDPVTQQWLGYPKTA